MRQFDYLLLAAIALMPRLLILWALPLASGTTDPNCAPDELAHFWVVREMSFGRFEPWSPGAFSIYSSFLPSQYAFQAAMLAIGRFLGGDIVRFESPEPLVAGYGYARLGSLLLGLITVSALAHAAWKLTESRLQAFSAGLVVAFLPQLVFVNAYVNADSFTIAGGALLTCSLVCWLLESRNRRRNSILLGVTLGFVLLGKLSGYYLLPPTAALIVLELRRQHNVRLAIPMLAACLATAGPVILWNTARSGGDILGLHAYREFLAHHWTRNPAPGPAPWQLFLSRLGMSTLGTYRNMDLFLPMPLYWCALALIIVGLAIAVGRRSPRDRLVRVLTAWFLSAAAVNVVSVWWNSWVVDFQPQGRYVLLTAACLAMIAVVAPMRALPRTGAQVWAATVIIFLLVAVSYSVQLIYAAPCLRYAT